MLAQFEIDFDFNGNGFRGKVTPLMHAGKLYYSVDLEGTAGRFSLNLVPGEWNNYGRAWSLLEAEKEVELVLIQAIGDEIEKNNEGNFEKE